MKRRTKAAALLLSLGLTLSCAVPVEAAEEEPFVFVPGYVDDGFDAPVSLWGEDGGYEPGPLDSTPLPSSFDLRNVDGVSYMTGVRSQGNYGTCWAHASIASMESNLLMQGYSGYENLSELQLVYFTYNRNAAVAAEGGGTAGDVVTHYGKSAGRNNVMQGGGNSIHAANAMGGRLGVIQETELRYTDTSAISKVINGTLEDQYARSLNDIRLDYYYEVSQQNRNAIKRLLMSSGAGSISYYEYAGGESRDRASYYQNLYTGSNHAVTLCGWDDNYPRSKFNGSAGQPSSNGAWLCKNSWGEWFGDSGYFWLSYEDASLTDVSFFGVSPDSGTDYLYQYDGGLSSDKWGYRTNQVFGANIFTAEQDHMLTEVRFEMMDADTTVTVDIYTGVTAGRPTSGVRQGEGTVVNCDFAGTYTAKLEQPILLRKGEHFSVVIGIQGKQSDAHCGVVSDVGDDFWGMVNSTVEAQPGQSFLSYNGTSWSSMDCNFRIKAIAMAGSGSDLMLPGDVNLDGQITIADGVQLARHILGQKLLVGVSLLNADVDGVVGVDSGDVLWIAQMLVGLTP